MSTQPKSDTPKTDEQINGKPCTRFAVFVGDSLRDAYVPSEFARQLERDLAAVTAELARVKASDEQNFRLLKEMADVLLLPDESYSLLPEKLRTFQKCYISEKQAKIFRGNEAEDLREQLAAITAERDKWSTDHARLQMELDASCNAEELRQVRAERDALRLDKERLDWLFANQTNPVKVLLFPSYGFSNRVIGPCVMECFRAAIDAARANSRMDKLTEDVNEAGLYDGEDKQ